MDIKEKIDSLNGTEENAQEILKKIREIHKNKTKKTGENKKVIDPQDLTLSNLPIASSEKTKINGLHFYFRTHKTEDALIISIVKQNKETWPSLTEPPLLEIGATVEGWEHYFRGIL